MIKLDLRMVQLPASDEIAEIVNAVNAESERTGALVLAEGIETEAHLATARAMGATLAQGCLFVPPRPSAGGRPEALPRVRASRTTAAAGTRRRDRSRWLPRLADRSGRPTSGCPSR